MAEEKVIDLYALSNRLQRSQNRAYILGLTELGDSINRQLRYVWRVIVQRSKEIRAKA